MISPDDYAAAVAEAIPANLRMDEVQGDGIHKLYEIKVGGLLKARLERDQAIAFIDGVLVGINLERQRERPSD